MRYFVFSLLALALFSCSPKVKRELYVQEYQALDPGTEIQVLEEFDKSPAVTYRLASIKVKDGGMTTNCGYDLMLGLAKAEARKLGANVVKITEHRLPGMQSSCDQIFADLYKLDNLDISDYREEAPFNPDADYATVFVYRPAGPGFAIGYDLYFNEEKVTRVKHKSVDEIKVRSFGEHEVWAKTESKTEIKVNFEKGKTYYIRCTLGYGVMVGRPELRLVSYGKGSKEMAELIGN